MKTLRSLLLAAALGTGLCGAVPALAANVALNAPVSLTQGSIDAGSAGLSSLTDGITLGNGVAWNSPSTIHWSLSSAPIFEINLGGLYSISAITLEHDNNDIYLVAYPLGSGVGFASLGPNLNGGGMATSTFTFASPVTATKLSLLGVGGDGLYAVSEISVAGVAVVPEPESYGMMLLGLALMGGVVMRRRAGRD